jgi:S1-C subfamily serine protease
MARYNRNRSPTARTETNRPSAQPASRSTNTSTIPIGLITLAAVGFGTLTALLVVPSLFPQSPLTTLQPEATTQTVATPISMAELYQRVSPAVVLIETGDGRGSGVIIDAIGTIVTNRHVVAGHRQVNIKTTLGTYTGLVTKNSSGVDLALVKIDAKQPLPCIHLATESLSIGQSVYALGNPVGLEHTFTNGMVSHLDGNGEILHTAAIAPGSSGSPLINERGYIVAINRAVRRDLTVGVAIPASAVATLSPTSACSSKH